MSLAATTDPHVWFRRPRPVRRPRLRLVCFPHAGGGPHLFRTWPSHLPGHVEVLAVCYPGRHARLAEPCIGRMEPLADLIARSLRTYDAPLVLFGHSMGALVAYEVALRLPPGTTPMLLVSAHPAPHRMPPPAARPATDDQLLRAMADIGGTDPAIVRSSRMRELILPAMRADHELLRTYRPRSPAPVTAPIIGYRGIDDPLAGAPDLAAWADVTTAGLTTRALPGGHFYLTTAERELLTDIGRRLGPLAAPDPMEANPCP